MRKCVGLLLVLVMSLVSVVAFAAPVKRCANCRHRCAVVTAPTPAPAPAPTFGTLLLESVELRGGFLMRREIECATTVGEVKDPPFVGIGLRPRLGDRADLFLTWDHFFVDDDDLDPEWEATVGVAVMPWRKR